MFACVWGCARERERGREKQMESLAPYIWSVALVWSLEQISIRFL